MKTTIFAVLLAFSAVAYSQSPNSVNAKQPSDQLQKTTAQPPVVVKLLPHQKSDTEVAEERQERAEKSALEKKLVDLTEALAEYTRNLFYATVALVIVTGGLVVFAKIQSSDTKASIAVAKESADAAVNVSKPFLFPRATRLATLHPIGDIADGTKHNPEVALIFENFGETPAILREVRVDLFLTEVGQLIPPVPAIEDLTPRRNDALIVIPGRIFGPDALMNSRSVITCDFRTLITHELRELAATADAISNGFRRFFLIGWVIYDDFFGIRTTHRFCLKLRPNGFQAIKGGDAYNSITREKIPPQKDENLDPMGIDPSD